MKSQQLCVRCDLPRNRHLPVRYGNTVIVAEPSILGRKVGCHRFTPPAPKWLRLLTWITGKASRL